MTHTESRCGGCGYPLVWGITSNGKRMPLDAEWEDIGVAGKTWVFESEAERVRPYQPLFDGAVKEHFVPHWETCRSADQFRSK